MDLPIGKAISNGPYQSSSPVFTTYTVSLVYVVKGFMANFTDGLESYEFMGVYLKGVEWGTEKCQTNCV